MYEWAWVVMSIGAGVAAVLMWRQLGRAVAAHQEDRTELARYKANYEGAQKQSAEWQAKCAELEVARAKAREDAIKQEAQNKAMQKAYQDIEQRFNTLSHSVLQAQKEAIHKDNQSALTQHVKPLRDDLEKFQTLVQQQRREASKEHGALTGMVEMLKGEAKTLGGEAQQLAKALRGDSQMRGAWGEEHLERMLQASGLQEKVHYLKQSSYTTEDGKRHRPDFIINLPNDRQVVVDAKTPLVHWQALQQEDISDTARKELGKRFVDAVRHHCDELAHKDYASLPQIRSLDATLMYIPLENAVQYIDGYDPELRIRAMEKKVILASPSTLIPVVRVIEHVWRQHDQQRNTDQIIREVSGFMDKVEGWLQAFDSVGKHLEQAQQSFGQADNRLQSGRGNVLRRATQIAALGVPVKPAMKQRLQGLPGGPEQIEAE